MMTVSPPSDATAQEGRDKMKLQNIPLDQVVWNPWRDKDLYPIDDDHVRELGESIGDHGFFGGVKGRRVNGKVEIACGHARIAAARKAKLETVPIFIDDLDDDAMLRLMTDENATQAGSNPGAVMNEVAAVTRRLIEGLLRSTTVEPSIAKAFESKLGIDRTRTKLRNGGDVHLALGEPVIRAYLGQGNAGRAHRSARQIREAISALKQSKRYDELVEQTLLKYPAEVVDAPSAKGKSVAKTEPKKSWPRMLDERTANVFKNENQFHAFREAVTTAAAQKAIPVSEQLSLAKEIMRKDALKQIGAPYIKAKVQERVQDYMKEQRKIDKEERDRYLAEQMEARIDDGLHAANASLRSLIRDLRSRHDEPPGSAMLNLTRLHLGIAHESQFQGLG
jgi:ParB/RepB/Spo0J family partition protein